MRPGPRPRRRQHCRGTERRADGKKASNEIKLRPFLVLDCGRTRSQVLERYRLLRLSFPLIECPRGSADSKDAHAPCSIPLEGSLRGHIGMRPRRLRSQHPDKSRCNISGSGLLHKDKGYARTWSPLDFPFAISFFKSIFLFQRISIASSFIAFGSPNFASLTCKLLFATRLRASRRACPRRDTQSACRRARNVSAPI
jgi:hypothetical protein